MSNDFRVGRKPDFRLKGMNKKTDLKGDVGAGWQNPDGSISIDLNAFVVLSGGRELVLTLFPVKENDDGKK